MPVQTTNCSSDYGSFHFSEKLIPLIINACACKALPIYGDGLKVGDWLYVGESIARRFAGCWKRDAWARSTTSQ